MKREFRECWYKGFPDASKYAEDTKESTGLIIKGLQALAKIEGTYSSSLQALKATYGLKASDKETSVAYAWEGVLAGLGDEGNVHKKISEDLIESAANLDKCWKKNCEEKKAVYTEGSGYEKDLNEFESQVTKSKAAYQKAAKNAEAAIEKRDEGTRDPTRMQLSEVLRMNDALETFTRSREPYIESLAYLQAAELVYRDQILGVMKKYEDIERNRIKDCANCLSNVVANRERELIVNTKIPQIIASIKETINKIDDNIDINNYVKKHSTRIPSTTAEFESSDSRTIVRNLAVETWVAGPRASVEDDPRGSSRYTSRQLPPPPPPLDYPRSLEVMGYKYKEVEVKDTKAAATTGGGAAGLFGKFFGSKSSLM